MPTGLPDVVDVLHPDAGLVMHSGFAGGGVVTAGDQRLEVVDRRLRQEHIVAPAVGCHRVRVDALMVTVLEE